MEPAYYNEYYQLEREHWWFRAREHILCCQMSRMISTRRIPHFPKILNIGAATGRSSQWLSKFGEVVSLEYDKNCCRLTRERTGLDIVEGTILNLPWGCDSFDVVCAFDVIEHVEDDKSAVAEMKRVCRKNGILFVTVPASPMLWSEHDEINHHFRRYRIEDLKALFYGCNLLLCSGFNNLLYVPIAAHRIARRVVCGLNRERCTRPLKSDFTRSQFFVINKLLEILLRSENLWLSKGYGIPWGVSAMVLASPEKAD